MRGSLIIDFQIIRYTRFSTIISHQIKMKMDLNFYFLCHYYFVGCVLEHSIADQVLFNCESIKQCVTALLEGYNMCSEKGTSRGKVKVTVLKNGHLEVRSRSLGLSYLPQKTMLMKKS